MKNDKLFLAECNKVKVPKYIQQIISNDLVMARTEITDSYLLHHSKHATSRTLEWRYEQLTEWIKKQGGMVLESTYDYNKEYCGVTEKFYPFRFRFPVFNQYKALFSFMGYK